MRILLVDDDAFLRDMYQAKFAESKHDVVTAANAMEALRVVQHEDKTFDVIVMDMVMPEMTGTDLIAALQEEANAAATVKIVLSNQGEERDRQEAKRAGADGYIVKADSIPSEVVSQVEALVAKHK